MRCQVIPFPFSHEEFYDEVSHEHHADPELLFLEFPFGIKVDIIKSIDRNGVYQPCRQQQDCDVKHYHQSLSKCEFKNIL